MSLKPPVAPNPPFVYSNEITAQEAFEARQTTGQLHEYATAAGTTIFRVDEPGNVTFGPSEDLDTEYGLNYVVADFYYSAETRRITTRSAILNEVNDPPDLRLGRMAGPVTLCAVPTPVSAGFPFDLTVAYAGTAFSPTNGNLRIGSMDVVYASKATAAATTTSGAQTLSRGTPGVLNVVDATPGNPGNLLTGGQRLARVGEEVIRYDGIVGDQLQNVLLYPGDCRASVSIAAGTTVGQYTFEDCVSDGSDTIGLGDQCEQNIYPVPTNGAHLAGCSAGDNLGNLMFRAMRNPAGAPAGGDNAENTNLGFAGESAGLIGIPVEPPRSATSAGALLLCSTPVGSITAVPRLEVMHDGTVRIAAAARMGNSGMGLSSVAQLTVESQDTAKNVLRLRTAASPHGTKVLEVRDPSENLLFQLGATSRPRTWRSDVLSATPTDYVEQGADSTGGWVDTTYASSGVHSLSLRAAGHAGVKVRFESSGGLLKMAFFEGTEVVQPTGVAVTAAGIHAALVSLNLITA